MTTQSPTVLRCERCRAVISSADAEEMIRDAVPCGVCGGTLALCDGRRRARFATGGERSALAEHRLLGVLREAEGRAVDPRTLAQAGIDDPADAIFELERAGHPIEREYGEGATGRRRFLGYRLLRRGNERQASSQPSSSR